MTTESRVSEDSWGWKSRNIIRLSRATEELEENWKIPCCYLLFCLLLTLFWCLFLYQMKTTLELADIKAGIDNHSSRGFRTDSCPSLLMCLPASPSWVLQTAALIIHILLAKLFSAQVWKKKHLKPKHWMGAAMPYIYKLNFVVLRCQVEAAAASNKQLHTTDTHRSFVEGSVHNCWPSRGFLFIPRVR